jgi:hypothetical protein
METGSFRMASNFFIGKIVFKSKSFKLFLFRRLCSCESCSDTLLAFCCPHCYAFCVSQKAGQGCCCNILQCVFYPFFLCCLRQEARDVKGIEVCLITLTWFLCLLVFILRLFNFNREDVWETYFPLGVARAVQSFKSDGNSTSLHNKPKSGVLLDMNFSATSII